MLFGGRAAFVPETETPWPERRNSPRGMIGVYRNISRYKIEFVWGGTLDSPWS